ncbi:small G protein [Pelomyxa schiedti]|nr:small G protein [Pelomyxa schiedti]
MGGSQSETPVSPPPTSPSPLPLLPDASGAIVLRVVMLGEMRTGKTALKNRLVSNTFSSIYVENTGVDFVTHPIRAGDKPVAIQIWDGCFNPARVWVPSCYFRCKHGALLVYDIRKTYTFDYIKDWCRRLEEHSPGAYKILVGNMCDDEANRQVPTATGRQLADELGIPFIECSAMTGANVQDAFLQLVTKILGESR